MTRRRDVLVAGFAAATLALVGCSGGGTGGGNDGPDGDPENPGVTGPGGTDPGSTPVETLDLQLRDNFFPAESASAADIPWDEVGPGWFAVDAHTPYHKRVEKDGELRDARGGVSLLSPDGVWYAATDFSGTNTGSLVHWDGDNWWFFSKVVVAPPEEYGRLEVVDQSDATPGKGDVAFGKGYYPGRGMATINGSTIEWRFSQDWWTSIALYRDGAAAGNVCMTNEDAGGGADFKVSPDGDTIICFDYLDGAYSDGTDVRAGSIASGKSKVITEFQALPYQYELVGWLDEDRFIFAKWNDGLSGLDQYFVYNVDKLKINDYKVPFAAKGDEAVREYLPGPEVYVTSAGRFYASDGSLLAHVKCTEERWKWSLDTSGDRAVINCRSSGDLILVNLETGETQSWDYKQKKLDVEVSGHPRD